MQSGPTDATLTAPENSSGAAWAPEIGERLQVVLAIALVAVLFSNLDGYAFESLGGPRPSYLIAAFFGLGLLLLCVRPWALAALPRNPLVLWALLYLAISSAWMFWSEAIPGAWQVFADRLRSTGVMLLGLVAFSSRSARTWSRRALAVLILLAAALNAVDLSAPLTFSQVAGRSAGLYINPNGAGLAIVFALSLCIDGIRERYRVPLFLAATAGVLMTLSRGALTLFVVALGWLIAAGRLSWRRMLLATFLVMAAAATLGGIHGISETLDETGLVAELAAERLQFGTNDLSADERRTVAAMALTIFQDSALVGRGLGASLSWDGQSSHNFFLNMAVDHGVVGIALVLLLILALWRCGPAARLPGTLVAVSCLFSHNVMDAEYELLTIAFTAAAGMASRNEPQWREEVEPA